MEVFVGGVGMVPFGRHPEVSLVSLLTEAAKRAIEDDGGLEVDCVVVGAMNPEEFCGQGNISAAVVNNLGLSGVPSLRVETASSSGGSVLEVAHWAVASGGFKRVLAVAGEKMTHLPTPVVTKILAEVIEPYERNAGASMVALAAMVTQAYAHEAYISIKRLESVLCKIAVKNHRYGARNPYAQFQKEITEEQYFNSRQVSFPLRLYDCSPITDGAAAMILTSETKNVKLTGIGHGTDTLAVRHRVNLNSFAAARVAAKKAYAMANRDPSDIRFAEVHDAFTCFEVIGAEDLGLLEERKGWKSVERGETELEGRIPINISGGLKSRGHPVGGSGLAQAVEIVWQIRGKVAPERQVKEPSIGMLHSIGGLANNNVVAIFEEAHTPPHGFGWAPTYERRIEINRDPKDPEEIKGREGVVDACTVLSVPPEGFPSPLVLGLISTSEGHRVLARAPTGAHFKVGEKVFLEKEENRYVFMKAHPVERLLYKIEKRKENLNAKVKGLLSRWRA